MFLCSSGVYALAWTAGMNWEFVGSLPLGGLIAVEAVTVPDIIVAFLPLRIVGPTIGGGPV